MSARHRSESAGGSEGTEAVQPAGALESTEAADAAITVVSGDPDAAELAAITAVLTAVAREAHDADALAAERGPDAWARSTRQLRTPLVSGARAWRGFSA